MNNIAYFEIHTEDPKRAMDFYSSVFGWEFAQQEGLPIDYWAIKTSGINGGLLKRPLSLVQGQNPTNAFINSIEVEDFDATAKVILELGGIVALEKFLVPGKCWQGYFLDTEGNTFGIFQVI